MSHSTHPEYTCPACGYKFDCATHIGSNKAFTPKSGDFTCCLKCGSVLRYAVQNVIMATVEEINKELHPIQRTQLLMASILIKTKNPLKKKQ